MDSVAEKIWSKLIKVKEIHGVLKFLFAVLTAFVVFCGIAGGFFWRFYGSNLERKLDRIEKWMYDTSQEKYPADGLIATFPNSSQPAISTSRGEQLSLLSDSALGGSSMVRYERIPHDHTKADGDAFLRIHYSLNPSHSANAVAYVGVYANFSNPVKLFDISAFSSVVLKLRAQNTNGASCQYFFAFCDANVRGNGIYAWAETEIPASEIATTNFVSFPGSLREFKTPAWYEPKIQFDQTRVFRFVIKIGTKGQAAKGFLDIDDIRFDGGGARQ